MAEMLTPGDSACDVAADAQSAGLVGPINGLQVGKVMQLQSDPQGDRMLVSIPAIDKDARAVFV